LCSFHPHPRPRGIRTSLTRPGDHLGPGPLPVPQLQDLLLEPGAAHRSALSSPLWSGLLCDIPPQLLAPPPQAGRHDLFLPGHLFSRPPPPAFRTYAPKFLVPHGPFALLSLFPQINARSFAPIFQNSSSIKPPSCIPHINLVQSSVYGTSQSLTKAATSCSLLTSYPLVLSSLLSV